jgi:hypothetical protein
MRFSPHRRNRCGLHGWEKSAPSLLMFYLARSTERVEVPTLNPIKLDPIFSVIGWDNRVAWLGVYVLHCLISQPPMYLIGLSVQLDTCAFCLSPPFSLQSINRFCQRPNFKVRTDHPHCQVIVQIPKQTSNCAYLKLSQQLSIFKRTHKHPCCRRSHSSLL